MPARASHRRSANQQDEDTPSRTRSGRGPKSAAKPDTKPEILSPKANSHQPTSTTPQTRKTTRQASTVTNYADLEAGNVVYGLWEAPIFHVFGIPREFLDGLQEQKPPKKRSSSEHSDLPALNTLFSHSNDSMSDDESEEELDSPQPAAARGRGRGGRGARGGRGRGRGRGSRGSRGAKASGPSRWSGPSRTRPSRNAAPAFPLMEDDDEELSNQESAMEDAKYSDLDGETTNELTDDEPDATQENQIKDSPGKPKQWSTPVSKTPPGSPSPTLVQAYRDPDAKIPVPPSVPKLSLPEKNSLRAEKSFSRTRTPKDGASTPVPSAPKLPTLAPEDDALSTSDLLGPWIENAPEPIEAECEDKADYLLQKRYKPMVDVQNVIASLTKYAFAQRSTESLYALAENTQRILKAWQDEYLELDARVGAVVS